MREQRTLSPLASALTRFAPASPLDSALTKNIPGGGGPPCDHLLSTLALDLQLFPVSSFRLTHFRKNASASPLESHTFKTKDLKPFRFTHFQKSGGGRGVVPSNLQIHASYLRSSLSPLDSALTSKRAPKPFRCNTYEKHTQGEGGCMPILPLPPLLPRLPVPHQPPLPPLPPKENYSYVRQAHRH